MAHRQGSLERHGYPGPGESTTSSRGWNWGRKIRIARDVCALLEFAGCDRLAGRLPSSQLPLPLPSQPVQDSLRTQRQERLERIAACRFPFSTVATRAIPALSVSASRHLHIPASSPSISTFLCSFTWPKRRLACELRSLSLRPQQPDLPPHTSARPGSSGPDRLCPVALGVRCMVACKEP